MAAHSHKGPIGHGMQTVAEAGEWLDSQLGRVVGMNPGGRKKATEHNKYQLIALKYLAAAQEKVGDIEFIEWHGKKKAGLAGIYDDGTYFIKADNPTTPYRLYVFLHEIGHLVEGHHHKELSYCLEEYEAERYAIAAMEREGVPLPEGHVEDAIEHNMVYAIKDDLENKRPVSGECYEMAGGSWKGEKVMMRNPAKFERCVRDVEARGEDANAYAVCTAAGTRNGKTKLDLMLDQVEAGKREITFDVRDWDKAAVDRLITVVRARGLDASSDGERVLVRDLRGIKNPSVMEFAKKDAAYAYARLMEAEGWVAKVVRRGFKWGVELVKGARNPGDYLEARQEGRARAREFTARTGAPTSALDTKEIVKQFRIWWDVEGAKDYVSEKDKRGNEMEFVRAFKYAGKKNPEGAAAEMYESFHGQPSEEVTEFVEDHHYHENLAELGVLAGVVVETEYAGVMALAFSGYKWDDREGAFELKAGRENPLFGGLFGGKTTHYSVKHGTKTTTTGKLNYKGHQIVSIGGEFEVPSVDPESRFDSVKEAKRFIDEWSKNPKRVTMSFAASTTYRPPHPERTAKRDSGYDVTFQEWPNRASMAKSIRMQESGPSTGKNWRAIVPLEQTEGYGRQNPDPTKNPDNDYVKKVIARYEATGRIAYYRPLKKTISLSGGAPLPEKEAVKRMLETLKKHEEEDRSRMGKQNPDPTNSDTTLLASNEKGTQLFLVGGDQSADLESFKLKGAEAEHESIVLGNVQQITYHTSKIFEGKREEFDYFHHFSEDTKGPLPTLRYDAVNEKLYLDGGCYKINKPFMGTSPGIED